MTLGPEWFSLRIIGGETPTGDPIPVRVGLVHTAGRALIALQVGDGPVVILPGQTPGELIVHARAAVAQLYHP